MYVLQVTSIFFLKIPQNGFPLRYNRYFQKCKTNTFRHGREKTFPHLSFKKSKGSRALVCLKKETFRRPFIIEKIQLSMPHSPFSLPLSYFANDDRQTSLFPFCELLLFGQFGQRVEIKLLFHL